MLFSTNENELPLPILIDNVLIQKVENTRFLGTIIDDKLSWKHHIDSICKLISRNIGMINKLKYFFSTKHSVILIFYTSITIPKLWNFGLGQQCIVFIG